MNTQIDKLLETMGGRMSSCYIEDHIWYTTYVFQIEDDVLLRMELSRPTSKTEECYGVLSNILSNKFMAYMIGRKKTIEYFNIQKMDGWEQIDEQAIIFRFDELIKAYYKEHA